MEIKKSQKIPKKFECICCDYFTFSKKDFNKHLSTRKHSVSVIGNKMEILEIPGNQKNPQTKKFICECMKEYKTLSGLWKHKKICEDFNFEKHTDNDSKQITNHITPEMVLNVLQQNKELTDLVVEQNKTLMEFAKHSVNTQTINAHNFNNNNKTFNLNVFLNETCKDAMNIMDFVDSLQLQLSDLENVGKVGYVEGISNIIVKNLQALDIHKRPVHCADKKREILYVKDEDKWEKESEDKNKIRKAIKKVACKNQKLLKTFKEAHPGCNFSESKYSDQYSKIVIEATGGLGSNDMEKEDKIIKNIAKEVVIDKKDYL